ncbi:MAG: hypothetical protein IJD78_07145 [Clostridia bacterium]|nr:hypothetical protein [Clostridia bacterium]
MKAKRFISFFLAIAILVASVSISAVAVSEKWKAKNEEPFIFIHGLNGWGGSEGINGVIPYWGATTGDLMDYLRGEGYECYSASVGPLSSAWDRACELYAQLTGTTVDYGEAHAKAHNHDRYGRTFYQPLVKDWGELDKNGKIEQVHLIGHSFGGTTARMLVYLLGEGSAEEIAATPADDISPLFTGGKSDWVKSVTTICTPHNSASVYYPLQLLGLDIFVQTFSYIYAGLLGRSYLNGRIVDFYLEQFGLTDIPGGEKADMFFKALKLILENKDDSCQYDLTPEGTKKMNETLDINDDIYYFSYAFSTTHDVLGVQLPDIRTNPVIYLTSVAMGIGKFTDPVLGTVYDGDWLANDALVNTESAKYPIDEPHKDFESGNIEKGIWNVMPVERGDHGTAIGLFAPADETHEFYIELCEMLNALPD